MLPLSLTNDCFGEGVNGSAHSTVLLMLSLAVMPEGLFI